MVDPYVREYPSPSGAYLVRTVDNEVKMSHWISAAVLLDAAGAELFDFGSSWSADTVRWIDDSHVELAMRHYPGDRDATLVVDVAARTAIANGSTLTFAELLRWMS